MLKKPHYLVILCPRCGSVRYVKSSQKTAQCLKCGYRMSIDRNKIRILLETPNRKDAINTVKAYKMSTGFKKKIEDRI